MFRQACAPWRSNRKEKNRLNLVQPVERVQRAHREFGVGGIDQHRKLDLGGGDGADVDVARGEGGERLRRDAGMAAHAAADHRDLGDVGGAVEPRIADPGLGRGDGVAGAVIVGGRNREGEVGGLAVLGDVLHDHVDVDIGIRQADRRSPRRRPACPRSGGRKSALRPWRRRCR